jgi:hypothetical protein
VSVVTQIKVGLTAPQQQTPHVTYTLCDTTKRSSRKLEEYKLLSMMAVPCPVCSRSFTSEAALQAHTGTSDPTLRKAHVCTTCNRRLCSEQAVNQHQEFCFKCDGCKKMLSSEKTMAAHKTAKHANEPAHTTNSANGGVVEGTGYNQEDGFIIRTEPRDSLDFGGVYNAGTTDNRKKKKVS